MFNKKLILKYESTLSNDLNSITPAKNHIPEWYKKIPQWKNNDFFNSGNFIKPTVKLCFPFLDSLTIGYMITLPYDLYVKNNNGNPILIWPRSVEGNPPGLRDYIADEKLVPFEHYAKEFTWNYYVSYSFPIGYSGILTHPLNRHDLPFTTLTGIIDGGLVMSAHGNVPFYIKKGFEGLIEQGTPIAQLIPFRQENWKSEYTKGLIESGNLNDKITGMVFRGWYKKRFWKKKNFD